LDPSFRPWKPSGVNLITLTTDFGARDWFVGTMKGVILGLCPRAAIVDITHEIPPGDIRAGAFALAASCRFFPKGAVHVAVIDPGVGGSRPAIAVQTSDYFFVGPDNGVLSFALAREKIRSIRRLENERWFLSPVSQTFHGRDIFSPVAARLSGGLAIQKLGPLAKDFLRLPWPEPRRRQNRIEGEIVYLDRFGNAITNIDAELLRRFDSARVKLRVGRRSAVPIATHYQAVPRGQLLALIGSSGLLEIAINGGSAAGRLKLRLGDKFELILRP
jgi:S-adenosylmethionine hydrolase